MLSCQRHLFTLPDEAHYINCAYMSPILKAAEEAGMAGMHLKRVPSDISPAMFFKESSLVRQLFATLVGVAAQQVALIPAASYGIATVAHNLAVKKGQNIVVLHEQFPSNVYTWRRLAGERGAELRTVVPPGETGRAEEFNARLLASIDRDTAVVAVGPVHWTDGTRIDLEAVGRRTSALGVAFVVDGTQSVGAMPIDAQALGIDALVCAAYKWMLGPYSIGAMYLGPRFMDGIPLEETWVARQDSENFDALVNYGDAYRDGALRYDVGGRSNFILVPMMIKGLEQVLAWGPANIQAYCHALMREVLQEAEALGYSVSKGSSAHLFGLRVPDHIARPRLQEALQRRGVSVSLRGEAIRISPHVYNNEQDVAALHDALVAASQVSTPSYSTPA